MNKPKEKIDRITNKIRQITLSRHNLTNSLYYDLSGGQSINAALNKLGKLEDLMQDYNVQNIEELENLFKYSFADICNLENIDRWQDNAINELTQQIKNLEKEQIAEMQEHQEAMKLADDKVKVTNEQNERLKYKLGLITSDNQDLNKKASDLAKELSDKESKWAKWCEQQLKEQAKKICDEIIDCLENAAIGIIYQDSRWLGKQAVYDKIEQIQKKYEEK